MVLTKTQTRQRKQKPDRAARRTSPNRETKLQRDSRRRTGEWGLSLSIKENCPTARCRYKKGDYYLTVSGREFEQPVTDYKPLVWDRLVQKVLTLHENAHVLYTDFEDLRERIEKRDSRYERVYHSLHNALEDGRIELLITNDYPTYEEVLEHVNDNFMRANDAWEYDPTHQQSGTAIPDDNQCAAPKADGERCGRGRQTGSTTCWQHDESDAQPWGDDTDRQAVESNELSVYDAVELGLMDKGVHDIGRYDALLDATDDTYMFASDDDRETFISEIDPLIREAIDDVQSKPDPVEANKRVVEFVDTIIPYLEQADNGGIGSAGERDGESPIRPDDAGEMGQDPAPAEADNIPDISDLSDASNIEVDPDTEGTDQGTDTDTDTDADTDTDGDNTESDGGDGDSETDGSEGDTSPPEKIPEIEAEIQEEIEAETAPAAASGDGENDDGDVDPMVKVVNSADSDSNLSQQSVEDVTPKPNPEHGHLIDDAKDSAVFIQQALSLEGDYSAKLERQQSQGRVDSPSLTRAYIGDSRRYKATQTEPDKPEFNLAFVLDRSGSMHDTERETAVSAVLQSAFALDAYPRVDVGVYELYNDQVRRAMPLGESVDDYTGALAHGEKAGGTPLTNALALCRERVELESGPNVKNRIFVVTDGEPDNEIDYQDELEQTNIPVVGLSITDHPHSASSGDYHRHRTIPRNGTGLTDELKQLLDELTQD